MGSPREEGCAATGSTRRSPPRILRFGGSQASQEDSRRSFALQCHTQCGLAKVPRQQSEIQKETQQRRGKKEEQIVPAAGSARIIVPRGPAATISDTR